MNLSAYVMLFSSQVQPSDLLHETSPVEQDMSDKLRHHLQFFFMDPMMKWKVRHQFPFKLALQILKIVFITAQVFFSNYYLAVPKRKV